MSEFEPPQLPPLPMVEALRRYWKQWIGLAVYPLPMALGVEWLGVPFIVALIPFPILFVIAIQPYGNKCADFAYGFAVMLLFFGGGGVAIFASLLLQALGLHPVP